MPANPSAPKSAASNPQRHASKGDNLDEGTRRSASGTGRRHRPLTTCSEHLDEVSRERDDAYRRLQDREAELARIQRIARVGGVEVDFRDGFHNRRSPEYLVIHGLRPDAANETHEDWVNRFIPRTATRTGEHFLRRAGGHLERLFGRIPHRAAE